MGRALKITLGIVGALALACGIGGAVLMSQFPSPQGDRLDPVDGIVGLDTGGSYVWVVRGETGAVVIDAGLDRDGTAIKGVLAEWNLTPDDVKAFLLTHAHGDHVMALNAFPKARVLADKKDRALLLHERLIQSQFGAFAADMMDAPDPTQVIEIFERAVPFEIDGLSFRPVHVPGHTLGSTAFVHDKVVFSGDAVCSSGDGVMVLPAFISEDFELVMESLGAFASMNVDTMLDGHAGITTGPKSKIAAFLGE